MLTGLAAYEAIGLSVSTTITNTIDRLASRMPRAISLGVR
jgi:hypothetical protein